MAIWTGQNTLLINNKTVLAFADRLMVGHHTLLVQITAETTARAITTSIAASRIIGAIIIAAAAVDHRGLSRRLGVVILGAPRRWATTDVRPANVTLWAFAARLVQHDSTQGIVAAGGSQAARIDTAAVFAGKVHSAVSVGGTLSFYNKRLSKF